MDREQAISRIEGYLRDELDEQTLDAFETLMISDPEFYEEVLLAQALHEGLKQQPTDVADNVVQITPNKSLDWKMGWAIAATVLFGMSVFTNVFELEQGVSVEPIVLEARRSIDPVEIQIDRLGYRDFVVRLGPLDQTVYVFEAVLPEGDLLSGEVRYLDSNSLGFRVPIVEIGEYEIRILSPHGIEQELFFAQRIRIVR